MQTRVELASKISPKTPTLVGAALTLATLSYVFTLLRQPIGCNSPDCLPSEISIAIGSSHDGKGVVWRIIRKLPKALFGRGGGVEQAFKIGLYMTLLLVATVAFTISNLYLGPPTTTRRLNCSALGSLIAGVASAIAVLLGLGGLVG